MPTNNTTNNQGTGGDVISIFGRSGIVVAENGDYDAEGITNIPNGTITEVDVQGALNQLDSLKVPVSRQIVPGIGLSGGGSLSGNVTLNLANTTVIAGSYTNANITVDAQGRITAANNGSPGGVIGPGSSTDNAFVRWDGLSGSLVQNSTIIGSDAGLITAAGLTPSRAVVSDGSKQMISSSTTATQIGYLANTTSDVQTQLDARLPLAGGTMLGALFLASDPSSNSQAATKQYVDNIAQGVVAHPAVTVATTANITLSGEQTIDGVLTSGDRVLVKNQTDATQNGAYVSAAGAWSRSTDMNTWAEVPGAFFFVTAGSTQASTGWVCTSPEGGTIGVDDIDFVQFSSAATYSADGQGIELTGTVFSLELDGSTLSKSGTGLKVASGGITNTEINATAGINANKIGAGTVDDTEFGYLNGVTSAIQTQLDAKASAGANTDITSVLLNQTGLSVKGATSNALTIKPNETLSTSRTLNLVVNDASRTVNMSGDLTVSSGGATISGTNTGDQNLFGTISVSGQSDVVADSTNDTLTLVAGTNVTITTNATTDSVTINASGAVSSVNGQTGTVVLDAADIGVDNSGFTVLTGTNTQTCFDQTDAELLKARSTGIRYGGDVTQASATTVDVAAGGGGILDNTDPENPTYTPVTWIAQSGISVSSGLNYLYIDDTGTVNVTAVAPSHEEYRLSIWLASVTVSGGTITAINPIPMPIQQYAAQIWDVWRAYGLVKRDLAVSAASTNLTVAVGAGEIYQPGISFFSNALNPHEASFTANSPQTFRMATSTGTIETDVTNLDVGNYDVGGTVTAIPGSSSRATIFTIYKFPQGNVRILYGTAYYASLTDAFTALGSYLPQPPTGYNQAIIIGYILATKGATNLSSASQATFVQTNKFGGIGGAVSANFSGFLQAANNLSELTGTASTARANLGLTIGTDVQAYDPDLTTWAGITPGTGVGTALAVNVGTTGAFVANGGALGTPSSGTLTNATGLPISTGVSGLGTGVATFLGTPSSANLAAAVTDETGSGALVFGTSPTLTTPRFADLGYIADSNGNEMLVFDSNASSVNQLVVSNAVTGSGPTITASGDDTDVYLVIQAKGTGGIILGQSGSGYVKLNNNQPLIDSSNNELLKFTSTASAVNEITLANAATGNNPKFTATGDDSNIGIDFQSKGSGVYRLLGDSTQAAELRLYEDTDDGSNYTAFKVGTQSADLTYTLPTAYPGGNGYSLTSSTSGVLGWTNVSGGGGGSPGGSNTQLQYNNAGAFGGITGATTDGTTLTLVAPVLGTPSSGTLTNCSGLPMSSGVTGQLPLANGGTGANLTDPNADRIMFWDDSAGQTTWLTAGSGLSISGTTIVATGPSAVDPATFDFRITLVSGTPVMTTSQTAKTTLYMTPYKGNALALYDGSAWAIYTSAEISLSLSGYTASKNYDIFVYSNSGTPTLESVVWTNDTTRATGIAFQNGVYSKVGDTTRRYVGTIRINSTGGQCDWKYGTNTTNGGAGDLGVWNYYNRVNVASFTGDTTDSWTYSTTSWRSANNSATNRCSFVTGVAEDSLYAAYDCGTASSTTSISAAYGVGLNSTTAFSGHSHTGASTAGFAGHSLLCTTPSAGYNYVQALEYSSGSTSTYYGDAGAAWYQSGLSFIYLM